MTFNEHKVFSGITRGMASLSSFHARFILLFVFFLVGCVCILHAQSPAYLIEWGQTTPDSKLLRKHYQAWEAYLPFDGVVIPINTKAFAGRYGDTARNALPESMWPLSWLVFSGHQGRFENYAHVISDLKDAEFEKFKNNFIPVYLFSKPGFAFNWYNDAQWEAVLHNIKIIARIARESRCKGIWIDTEQYGGTKFWDYLSLKRRFHDKEQDVTYQNYQLLVRGRAMEFIKAINEEFPHCRVVLSFGASLTYHDGLTQKHVDINNPVKSIRSLLPAFVDGLILGADAGTQIIDGYELSYFHKDEESFKGSLDEVRNKSARYSISPEVYYNKIGVSFGLYPVSDRQRQRLSPKDFQNAVMYGLKHTEHYVWTWTQKETFWVVPPNGKNSKEIVPAADQANADYPWDSAAKSNYLPKRAKRIPYAYVKALEEGKRLGLAARQK